MQSERIRKSSGIFYMQAELAALLCKKQRNEKNAAAQVCAAAESVVSLYIRWKLRGLNFETCKRNARRINFCNSQVMSRCETAGSVCTKMENVRLKEKTN